MEPPESTAASSPSAAEKVILRWDSTASEVEARDNMIFTSGDRLEINRYLAAVDELQKSMSSATLSDSSSATLQIAMARLEDEFRSILLSYTSPIEADSLSELTHPEFGSQEFELKEEIGERSFEKQFEHQESNSSTTSSCYQSSSSIREVDLIPCDAVEDLRSIAERMIAAGYIRECVQVYASLRKSAVDASLKKLNVEKLSIGDIQRMEWEALETKIRRWIRTIHPLTRYVMNYISLISDYKQTLIGLIKGVMFENSPWF